MDSRLASQLEVAASSDEEFVVRTFRLVLRRDPEPEALERALAKLAEGTLSRATLVAELATSDEFQRVRLLDDATAAGAAARARGERLRWLQGPAGTDERVIEIPWVLSRLRGPRVLEVGYAFAEPAYLAALLTSGFAVTGVDLAEADAGGMETVRADVRELPFDDGAFDCVLCVSTLEHVGADNTVYGLAAESAPEARAKALAELRRVLARDGRLLVTVPTGERGDHGWFRQEEPRGWERLFARAGFFVEEQEVYELGPDGWRSAPAFDADGVRYGERGPGASAVLCAELSPRRLARLLTLDGLERTARRRGRRLAHRVRGVA